MNVKTTFILLLVLAVLGGFYLIAARQAPPTDFPLEDRSKKTGQSLFKASEFPTASIESITIEHDQQTIEMEKDGADWRQTAPVEFALDTYATKGLCDDAAKLSFVEKLHVGGPDLPDLAAVNLSPSIAVLTFNFGPDTPKQTVKLGDRLAIGGRGYVMINDSQTVYVVNDDLHKRVLEDDIYDLRKKKLDGPKAGQADRITYERHRQTIVMDKSDGKWALTAPHGGRVDAESVKKLLDDIGNIYVSEFVADRPDSLAFYGLDEPQAMVTVRVPPPPVEETSAERGSETASTTEESDAEPTEAIVRALRIGIPVNFEEKEFYATWSLTDDPAPVVFTISDYNKKNFDKKLDDFRDARITPIDRRDIREVAIDRQVPPGFKLLYRESAWSFGEPGPGYDVDHTEIGKLVDAITEAKAKSYQPGAAKPTGELRASVTVSAIGRSEPDVLKIYEVENPEQYMVQRNNETTGYLVAIEDLGLLFEPTLTFRQRQVLSFADDNLSRLVVQRPDGVKYTFEREFHAVESFNQEQLVEPAEQVEASSQDESKAAQDEAEPDTKPVEPPASIYEPGPWQLVGQIQFESETFENLLPKLLTLEAERWHEIEPKFNKAYELILASHDGSRAEVTIDAETRLGRAVGSHEDGSFEFAGFEISEDLLEALDKEFRFRTVLEIKASEIAKVTLTKGETTLTVSKDEDGDYVGASGEEIDDSAAGDLFDTLAGLRAARFTEEAQMDQTTSLSITRKADDPIELVIDPKQNLAFIKPSTWFELDEDDMTKLTAELVKSDD